MSKTEFVRLQENAFAPLQQKIVSILTKQGPLTRKEICNSFGYMVKGYEFNQRSPSGKKYSRTTFQHEKRTTIYDNLIKLQKRKVIEKFTRNDGSRGRPRVFWKLID